MFWLQHLWTCVKHILRCRSSMISIFLDGLKHAMVLGRFRLVRWNHCIPLRESSAFQTSDPNHLKRLPLVETSNQKLVFPSPGIPGMTTTTTGFHHIQGLSTSTVHNSVARGWSNTWHVVWSTEVWRYLQRAMIEVLFVHVSSHYAEYIHSSILLSMCFLCIYWCYSIYTDL